MALLYGATLALLLLMGILVSESRILDHDPNGIGGVNYPAADFDPASGGNSDSGSGGSGAHVHFRSAQSENSLPPEVRAQLPAELRKLSDEQIKQLLMDMAGALNSCTVSQLNLADLSGTWMLSYISMSLSQKVTAEFKNDQPGHMVGTLTDGQNEQKFNFTQVPMVPGLLIHFDSELGSTPLYIVAHKRHRFIATVTVTPHGLDYAIYVRVKSSSKKPKTVTKAEIEEAKTGIRCLRKFRSSDGAGGDASEPVFHKVL